MMEKRKPHYLLKEIHRAVATPGSRPFTKTALDGGRALGLTEREMREMVLSVSTDDFYKSMTTYGDHSIWQDVYRFEDESVGTIYIKFSIATGRPPVIQFKTLE